MKKITLKMLEVIKNKALKIETSYDCSEKFPTIVRIYLAGIEKFTFHSDNLFADYSEFKTDSVRRLIEQREMLMKEKLDKWDKILFAYLRIKTPSFLRFLIKKPTFF